MNSNQKKKFGIMFYRPKLRQSLHKNEDEETLKQKVYEQKLQEKKEILRTEFHASELEKGVNVDSSEELISSKNELKFKSLLNEIVAHRQSLSKTFSSLQKRQSTHSHSKSSILTSKSLESSDNIFFLENRLNELTSNEIKVSETISIEFLRMESNEFKLSEYEKTIHILKERNYEHNYCLSLYQKGFEEMKGVLCASKNRKFRGETNLKLLKKDFNEKKDLEDELLMERFKLTKESKTRIKTDEEMIGNVMIQIDEKNFKLQETFTMLEDLKIQEEEIKFKRDQIHKMQNYLEVLKELETMFLNPNEPLILNLNQNKDKIIEDRKKSISLCLDHNPNRKRGKTTFDKIAMSLIDETPAKTNKKFSFSNQTQIKSNRIEVLGRIEKFFESHPLGILDLINKLIDVYRKLTIQSQSLERNYSEKIRIKSDKEGELCRMAYQFLSFSKDPSQPSENPILSSPQTFNLLNSRDPQDDKIESLARRSRKYCLFIIHIQIFVENAFLRLAQNLKLTQKISKDVPFEIISFVESFLNNRSDFLRTEDKLREITQFSLNNISETFESTWYVDTPKQLKESKRGCLKKEITFEKNIEEGLNVSQEMDLKTVMEELLFEKKELQVLQKNICSSLVMQFLKEKVLSDLLMSFEKSDLIHNFEKVELEAFNLISDEVKHQFYMFEKLLKKINYYIKEVPEKESKISEKIVTNSEIKAAHLKMWSKLSKDSKETQEEESKPTSNKVSQHEEPNFTKYKLEQSQLLSMIGREKNFRSPFFKKTEKKIQLHAKDTHVQKQISKMEKDATTDEEFLEFTRLRIKTPEYQNLFSETKNVAEGRMMKRGGSSSYGGRNMNNFLKDLHTDIATFGQLQRIERISSKVDNVSDLHYSLLKNKRITNSTFKQSSIFKSDRSDLHFLTPTKAYLESRSSKKTSSIFTKRFESENNNQNEPIKTPNSFHRKIKSIYGNQTNQFKRRRIKTVSGDLIKETNYWLNSPDSIRNNFGSIDYNILFHGRNLE